MSGKGKIAIVISLIVSVIVVIIAIITIIGASIFMKYQNVKRENQKAADRVVAMINQVDERPVTLETENLLVSIKAEYDVLTDKQKELVSNYSVLEKAFDDLENEKDKKVAEEFSKEISAINTSTLTADDVSVANLIKQYDKLTEKQKSYVENYDLLIKYKDIVDTKIAEKKQRDSGINLAENFQGHDGAWGDFGGHVNEYQGMVEAAIRRDVRYKEYFQGDVDSLRFKIGRFEKYSTEFVIGIAEFYFEGPDKEYGYNMCVWGEVVIKQDGTLYCREIRFY